jgi:hypothetical protein
MHLARAAPLKASAALVSLAAMQSVALEDERRHGGQALRTTRLNRPSLRQLLICAGAAWVVFVTACSDDDAMPPGVDAGAPVDAGPEDAARPDTGAPDAGTPCEDADGDGYRSAACGGDDCDDANAERNPGATEICDGDDEDCDDTSFGGDADGDGYTSSACCNGATNCGDDCDDALNTVNPGAAEQCNGGRDDDCDGLADSADGVCVPCGAGYTGFDRDCTDVDECATAGFCGTGAASCTNEPGTFRCACAAGYATAAATGALCENIDECATATNPCGAGTCTDNAGSYTCTCQSGYRLESVPAFTCVDVDECATGTDTCDDAPASTCTNTPGGFTCACPPGHVGDGRGVEGCRDIDECATNADDCDDAPDACVNTPGGFTCTCPGGFIGDGRGRDGCLRVDASLRGITVGVGALLSPAFASDTTDYTVLLPPGRMSTSLTVEAADASGAMLSIEGTPVATGATVTLRAGPGFTTRTVSIVVTAESGTSRTYTLRVVRRSVYVKASNTAANDYFGESVALSADGSTLAVGALLEDSAATGIDGDPSSNGTTQSGAVYVYRRTAAGDWSQEAYVKASNTGSNDEFGQSVALSADGSTLVVGATSEDSAAAGVGGDPTSNSLANAGAVYVFRRDTAGAWAQEAYVKASNPGADDSFGCALALSADGATLAVAASAEDSSATGVGGDGANDGAANAGAVYVFQRDPAGAWAQEAYIKASNTDAADSFGRSVALSADAATLAVGAPGESSVATGVDGDESSDGAPYAGAVYVFRRSGSAWAQSAYLKASNTGAGDNFGFSVALSADAATLAVGAHFEDSASTGVGGDDASNAASDSGAVYVFRQDVRGTWSQDAYVKASNTGARDAFGIRVTLSADGTALVAAASSESSTATGIGGDGSNNAAPMSGAAYVFRRDVSGAWSQAAYVKASNTSRSDLFGTSIALSGDGETLAVGARQESSSAVGIGGDESDNTAFFAGAAYVF